MKRAIESASVKGASSWLNTLPIENLGYALNKEEFRDALALRCNWIIQNIPPHCACGHDSNIDHLLTCKRGGCVIMRHNAIRDALANVMKEICHDVKIEPALIPVEPEERFETGLNPANNTQLNISARGFWAPFDRTYFDIRVRHPNCPSNRNQILERIYEKNENAKKTAYNERVMRVERGPFTPMVFLTSAGMSRECASVVKRMALLLEIKKKGQYAEIIRYVRTRLRIAT